MGEPAALFNTTDYYALNVRPGQRALCFDHGGEGAIAAGVLTGMLCDGVFEGFG